MNPEKIKLILESLFNQYSPGTIREGSVLSDQILTPAAILGAPLYQRIESLVKQNSLPEDGDYGELLDKIGERLLAPRVIGSRARASIRIALSTPGLITVPRGTVVTSASGAAFQVLQNRSFANASFSQSQKWGRTVYLSPEIQVEALGEGSEYIVPEDTLTGSSFAFPNFVGVYNPAASSGASVGETNAQYLERLRTAISSRALDTNLGLLFKVGESFGGEVRDVSVVPTGSPLLKRERLRTRRVLTHGSVDVRIQLDRTADVTSDIAVQFNGDEDTLVVGANTFVLFAWNPATQEYVPAQGFATEAAFEAAIDAAPYGSYVIMVVRANTSVGEDLQAKIQNLFGSVLINDRANNIAEDFVLLTKKGDPGFISKELFSNPTQGQDIIESSSLSIEQTGGGQQVGFANKTRGLDTPNGSKMYTRPSLNKLVEDTIYKKEITQEEYNLLARPDFRFVRSGTSILFKDDFVRRDEDGTDILLTTALQKRWVTGNTGESKTNRDSAAGVFLYDGKLILGPKQLDASKIDEAAQGILDSDVGFIFTTQLYTPSDRINQDPPILQEDFPDLFASIDLLDEPSDVKRALLWSVFDAVQRIVPSQSLGMNASGYKNELLSTSPVVQRELEDPYGFRMVGSIKTTNQSGDPIAITSARNSPDEGEMFRWYEGYGISLSISDEDGLPNLFVIDNASTDREMVVVGDELVNGKMDHNVLSQTIVDFNPGEDYKFELAFGSPSPEDSEHSMSLEFRLWAANEGRPTLPTISYGSYVPMSRRTQRLVNVGLAGDDINQLATQNVIANHVGFGVSNTRGESAWVIENFAIENIDEDYAQSIFSLDVKGQSEILDLQVIGRGKGYSTTSGTKDYGHEVYVWNPTTNAWDLIIDESYAGFFFRSARAKINLASYAFSGRVLLLATSKHPHQGLSASFVESVLDIDFLLGEDYREEEVTGGKADLLITQNPQENDLESRPSTESSHVIPSAAEINVLTPALFSGPIEQLVSVKTGSGISLTEDDYRVFWENESLRGTMRERLVLAITPNLTGIPLTVTVRAHNSVSGIQDYVNTTDVRKVDSDLLIRHRTSVFMDVTAQITGTWTESKTQQLRQFIFSRTEPISKTDIISFFFTNGAKNVTLSGPSSLTVKSRRFTSDGDWSETTLTDTVDESPSPDECFVPGDLLITVI